VKDKFGVFRHHLYPFSPKRSSNQQQIA